MRCTGFCIKNTGTHTRNIALTGLIKSQILFRFSPYAAGRVKDSKALREAYGTAIELLSEFYTAMGQNQALYQAYVQLAASDEFSHFTPAQRQTIEQALRDFTLSGVGLTGEAKTQFASIFWL